MNGHDIMKVLILTSILSYPVLAEYTITDDIYFPDSKIIMIGNQSGTSIRTYSNIDNPINTVEFEVNGTLIRYSANNNITISNLTFSSIGTNWTFNSYGLGGNLHTSVYTTPYTTTSLYIDNILYSSVESNSFGWAGYDYVVNGDHTMLIAISSIAQLDINIQILVNGDGYVMSSCCGQILAQRSNITVPYGSLVYFEAHANTGSTFNQWTGNGGTSLQNPIQITANSNGFIEAWFNTPNPTGVFDLTGLYTFLTSFFNSLIQSVNNMFIGLENFLYQLFSNLLQELYKIIYTFYSPIINIIGGSYYFIMNGISNGLDFLDALWNLGQSILDFITDSFNIIGGI